MKKTLAHILLLTHPAMSSSSQSPTISDDHPRRTPGGPPAGFRTLPRFLSQFKIKMAAALWMVNLWIVQTGHLLVAFSLVWFDQGGNILLLKVRQAFSTLRILSHTGCTIYCRPLAKSFNDTAMVFEGNLHHDRIDHLILTAFGI